MAGWTLVAKVTLPLLALLACSQDCLAGPKVLIGKDVPAAQRVPITRINHAAWTTLLRKYVNRQGQVAYAKWKSSAADTRALDDYLATLSHADPNLNSLPTTQLAFWINAYNALTIKGILREHPTSSIRNHTARVFGYNIWKDLQLIVGGTPISLEDIEHRRLRPSGEARIHFAIVCASRSCPRLLNEAYLPETLEEQLKSNAIGFFAQAGNFRYDMANRRFHLSAILKWFADDFGTSQATRLRKIAPYLPTRAAYDAAVANAVSITYQEYYWELNEQPR